MKKSTKSHQFPQSEQAINMSNVVNDTKTTQIQIKPLKFPSKTQRNNQKNSSLSRKIYIVTEQDDRIIESIPTAKHTFLSQQHSLNGQMNFSGFYTSRKEEKDDKKMKYDFVEPDITSEVNKLNVSGRKSSRFYYKEEEYELLEKDELKEQAKKKAKEQQKKNTEKGIGKEESIKEGYKHSAKQVSKYGDETPKSNPRMLTSYLQKMNRQDTRQILVQEQLDYLSEQYNQQQQSPFAKKSLKQTQVFSPSSDHQSRFSSSSHVPQRSQSPLQQSHQKLFSKCFKQTYFHLKLMLKEIHESQQNIYILHKEITHTVYEVIKQRASALKEEMNCLVEEICAQWLKDEWEFVVKNQIRFIDDVLEIQQQLSEREQEVHGLIRQLEEEENKKPLFSQRDQEILVTFNKHLAMNSRLRNQTSWKKVTTDLLMSNYENNVIQIQSLIQKISQSTYEKCNKAISALPSSQMFAQNTHSEILNTEAKKWFRSAVLVFMNDASRKAGAKQSLVKAKRESPKKKLQLDRTYFGSK